MSEDQLLLSSYIETALITVRIDPEEMSIAAMSLLLKSIKKEPVQSITV